MVVERMSVRFHRFRWTFGDVRSVSRCYSEWKNSSTVGRKSRLDLGRMVPGKSCLEFCRSQKVAGVAGLNEIADLIASYCELQK